MAPKAPLPTGRVTLLFTDIEGSTQHWEGQCAAMAEALRRHDDLLRTAIGRHGGHVFKTMGDQFCAVFSRASSAIAAATDAQRALARKDWSAVGGLAVRMALHTGTANERDGDYFGPPVNRVARLLATAHGGQVVVSGATAHLMRGVMPKRSELRDLGGHRLKDLVEPEHVWQLVAPGLPDTFPALASLGSPNNLPRTLSPFIGREQEVADIAALLKASDFVTLVGAGGVGKTRCALAIAAAVLDEFADGVWFVDLAPLSDSALVANAIAHALSLPLSSNREPLDTVVGYLKRKHLLLVLDNCEHVIDAARSVVATILQSAPDVQILSTSRESLAISGEKVYRLPSLPLPAEIAGLTADEALRYGSVALFADRAKAADAQFVFTDSTAPMVAEICRRLDGIPLAIELAAARVKVLSIPNLAQRLDERFTILTGGGRDALPRQKTLRALIDWSYDLLTDDEREIFRKLSIFVGGFTLATASAVCSDETTDEIAILDLLSSLVDKSLVQTESLENGTRYSLLESTRQYAYARLTECGERDALARSHATAYVSVGERLDQEYETTPDPEWMDAIERELGNWRFALEWTLRAGGDVALGQRLAGLLRWFWNHSNPSEGRRWVQRALEAGQASSPIVAAKLELAAAQFDGVLALNKASYAAAQKACDHFSALDERLLLADAMRLCGRALVLLGELSRGEELLHDALACARQFNVPKLQAWILQGLAWSREFAGDISGTRQLFQEALASCRSAGADYLAGNLCGGLAENEFRSGDVHSGLGFLAEALAAAQTIHSQSGVAICYATMSAYFVALNNFDEARAHARKALTLARDLQLEVDLTYALQHLAAVAALGPIADDEARRESRLRACRSIGYIDARLCFLEAEREYTERQEYERVIAALRLELGDDAYGHLTQEGVTFTEDRVVAEAMLM